MPTLIIYSRIMIMIWKDGWMDDKHYYRHFFFYTLTIFISSSVYLVPSKKEKKLSNVRQ